MAKKGTSSAGKATLMLLVIALIAAVPEALYSIPLPQLISLEGAAYYQAGFAFALLALCASRIALPYCIGQQVQKHVALGDSTTATLSFRILWAIVSILGLIFGVILYSSSASLGNRMGMAIASNETAFSSVLQMTALFVLVTLSTSGLRGYYVGLRMLTPMLIAEAGGQLIKLIFGLILAGIWQKQDAVRGAMGAMLGLSIGEIATLLIYLIFYVVNVGQKQLAQHRARFNGQVGNPIQELPEFLLQSLLAFLATAVVAVIAMIDAFALAPRLATLGFGGLQPVEGYGLLAAVVAPIAFFLPVLALGLFHGFAGTASELKRRNKHVKAREVSSAVMNTSIMCGIGIIGLMIVIGSNMIEQLFGGILTADQLLTAGKMVPYLSVAAGFCLIGVASFSLLLGRDQSIIAVLVALFAVIAKWMSFSLTVDSAGINILGAAFSTAAGMVVFGLLNSIFAWQFCGVPNKQLNQYIKTILAALIASVVCILLFDHLLVNLLSSAVWLQIILSAVLFVLVYTSIVSITKATNAEEFENLPIYEIRR